MTQDTLQQVVESAVQASECVLYHMQLVRSGAQTVVQVYIDTASGVTLEECARVNRQLRLQLSNYDAYANYAIEVSSPGLDRALHTPEHYQAVIGKMVSVRCIDNGEKHRIVGRLEAVENDKVCLQVAEETKNIAFSDIIKSSLCVEV